MAMTGRVAEDTWRCLFLLVVFAAHIRQGQSQSSSAVTPRLQSRSDPFQLRGGDTARLACSFSGNISEGVNWTKGWRSVASELVETKVNGNLTTSTATIRLTNTDQAGGYNCRAGNTFGSAAGTVAVSIGVGSLSVAGQQSNNSASTAVELQCSFLGRLRQDVRWVSPGGELIVSSNSRDVISAVGSGRSMDSSADGTMDSSHSAFNITQKINFENASSSLKFSLAPNVAAGQYVCTGISYFHNVSTSFAVDPFCLPISIVDAAPLGAALSLFLLNSALPVKCNDGFTRLGSVEHRCTALNTTHAVWRGNINCLKKLEVPVREVGEERKSARADSGQITLTCSIQGLINGSISWVDPKGHPVLAGNGVNITEQKQSGRTTVSTLSLPVTPTTLSGPYSCRARNELGAVNVTTVLTVVPVSSPAKQISTTVLVAIAVGGCVFLGIVATALIYSRRRHARHNTGKCDLSESRVDSAGLMKSISGPLVGSARSTSKIETIELTAKCSSSPSQLSAQVTEGNLSAMTTSSYLGDGLKGGNNLPSYVNNNSLAPGDANLPSYSNDTVFADGDTDAPTTATGDGRGKKHQRDGELESGDGELYSTVGHTEKSLKNIDHHSSYVQPDDEGTLYRDVGQGTSSELDEPHYTVSRRGSEFSENTYDIVNTDAGAAAKVEMEPEPVDKLKMEPKSQPYALPGSTSRQHVKVAESVHDMNAEEQESVMMVESIYDMNAEEQESVKVAESVYDMNAEEQESVKVAESIYDMNAEEQESVKVAESIYDMNAEEQESVYDIGD